ncbi:MAG: ABC transporter ATP-binding protein [Caldilineaceae bacterium]|nr:ABC transporter ATP-binding protein [Caldilineaceae bacterium]
MSFLQVEKITQTYISGNRTVRALGNISFEVSQGEFVCLVGTSGSGKSTLLRILGGLLTPSSGKVWLAGELVEKPPPSIGFVFQKSNLMPWRTVMENILLPLEIEGRIDDAAQDHARSLLATVGLLDFADAYPSHLSGGMAQRLALARALIRQPQLLLLDEPFGALDALTRERLNLELLHLWQRYRQTVVMVTHSIDEAVFMADRVLVLGGQPGHLEAQISIDLPRPRTVDLLGEPDYGRLRLTVRRQIGETA